MAHSYFFMYFSFPKEQDILGSNLPNHRYLPHFPDLLTLKIKGRKSGRKGILVASQESTSKSFLEKLFQLAS